jgi:Fur family ferric uptake transcriptional regulator
MNPAHPPPQHGLLERLRARGVRLTSQRIVLVKILDEQPGFVDVPTLLATAKKRGARVDRATVYRTLALLRTTDMLASGSDGSSADRSDRVSLPLPDDLRLTCERCGKRQRLVSDTPGSIRREILKRMGFQARSIRLEARGECRLCAERRATGQFSG